MSPQRARRPSRPALAVFCSGQGTNLQAIINAIRNGRLHARIAFVVTDRADAKALGRATRAGIEARYVDPRQYPTRAGYERALLSLLDQRRVELVCLAGFMRILSPAFIGHFPQRIVNIHPTLLPAFPGAHAVRDTLAWGAKITGVTVHLVDEHVDHGPILLQKAVVISAQETETSLLAKLHRIEHRLYPQAIRLLLEGRVAIVGRATHLR